MGVLTFPARRLTFIERAYWQHVVSVHGLRTGPYCRHRMWRVGVYLSRFYWQLRVAAYAVCRFVTGHHVVRAGTARHSIFANYPDFSGGLARGVFGDHTHVPPDPSLPRRMQAAVDAARNV